MNEERAKAILKAFGSCTSLYECTEPDELIKQYAEFIGLDTHSKETESDFVSQLLDIEDIMADRAADGAGSKAATVYQEWIERKKGVIFRLRELGIHVEDD